jgi:hypothetical protein
MPFVPPATYSSQANTGYEAQLSIGTVASPDSYVPVLEIKSFKPNYVTVPEVPTTHLLSPNATEEFFPGLIKPGTIDISGNFIGDSTQLSFTPLMQAQDLFTWKITAPVQRNTKTYTATGIGYIAEYGLGPFENNKAVDYAAKIQITGVYTESVA